MVESFVPVNISERAMKEVKSIMETKKIPSEYGLRVGVNGAGCAGISYLVGFDMKTDSDISYIKDGVTILVEKKHVMYLVGVEMDYVEGAEASGFTFNINNSK